MNVRIIYIKLHVIKSPLAKWVELALGAGGCKFESRASSN